MRYPTQHLGFKLLNCDPSCPRGQRGPRGFWGPLGPVGQGVPFGLVGLVDPVIGQGGVSSYEKSPNWPTILGAWIKIS